MPLPQKKLIPSLLLLLVLAAFATPPLWWSTGNSPVIDDLAPENNHGAANIGQAKHMVSEALQALEAENPSAAAIVRDQLTQPQPNPANPGQSFPPIVDLSVPDPKSSEWIKKQKEPLLVGQLKALSAPFYSILHDEYPYWLEFQLKSNQTKDLNDADNFYPWSSVTTDDQNRAIANIGQLKAVFALDFTTFLDADKDGLDDAWELAHGLNPNDPSDAHSDEDQDGLTALEEADRQTDPNKKDTDGDGKEDAIDAVGNDAEINWERTPEAKYVWVSQVEESAEIGHPLAVNKLGQILFQIPEFPDSTDGFQNILWDSVSQAWVNLAPNGSQSVQIQIGSSTDAQTLEAPAAKLIDINDDGTVYGVTIHDDFFEDPSGAILPPWHSTFGMTWKRSSPALDVYLPPTYFFKDQTIDLGHIPTMEPEPKGAIANDGAINANFSYHTSLPVKGRRILIANATGVNLFEILLFEFVWG